MLTNVKAYTMAKRVSVLLSEQEYTQVRSKAGLVPLSRWFKSLALGKEEVAAIEGKQAEDHRAEDMPKDEPIPMVQRGARAVKRVSASREPCKHGAYPGLCKHQECNR